MNEPQRHWKIVIDRQPQKEIRRLPSELGQSVPGVLLTGYECAMIVLGEIVYADLPNWEKPV